MSRPSPNRHLRGLRRIDGGWLSERITIRHYETRPSTTVGGEVTTLEWTAEVRAMVRPYDQWVGQIGARGGFENVPIEAMFGLRYGQKDTGDPATTAVIRDLAVKDEIDWGGRTFQIALVDQSIWVDGVALLCDAKG